MYRNWKVICKTPNTHLMWALATIDLDSVLGQRLVAQLPEYFTTQRQAGPVPLSIMRASARVEGRYQGNMEHGADYIVSFDAVPEGIPTQGFDTSGKNSGEANLPPLPTGINPKAKQGDIVVWEGNQCVVLENNHGCRELYIAPAELVAIDR